MKYWVKLPGNPHGMRSMASEVVVASLGAKLGAVTRPWKLLRIPTDLVGYEYAPGLHVTPGVAFGSRLLSSCEEHEDVRWVDRDNNGCRAASVAALWDLCLGSDTLQVVYDHRNDVQLSVIDYGLWFVGGEGDWSPEALAPLRKQPNELSSVTNQLKREHIAAAVEHLSRLDLNSVMESVAHVPVEWGTSDEDLEWLAHFIHGRVPDVIYRLTKTV